MHSLPRSSLIPSTEYSVVSALDSLARMTKILTGLDVSHHQPPHLLDWSRIAKDHSFAIARACYGSSPDKAFVKHVHGICGAGMVAGGYVFFRQHQPWREQFKAIIAQYDAAEMEYGAIVPAVDLEYNSSGADGPVVTKLHNGPGRKLVEALSKMFGACLVYCSPGHWIELGRPAWIGEHEVWTAHWGVNKPSWPDDWAIWQKSAKYKHPGFKISGGGPLDLNEARRLPLIV